MKLQSNNIKPKIIEIRTLKSSSGNLSIIDKENGLPFELKRIFYVYDIPKNTQRGGHAHKTLNQFIWVINGQLEITTFSKKGESNKFFLDSPSKGLFIPKLTWSYQITKIDNTIYCVAASDYYDENEYIRKWEDFIKERKN